jgi:hypothetical protein
MFSYLNIAHAHHRAFRCIVIVSQAPNDVKVRVAVAFNEVGMQLFQRHQFVEAFDYFSKSIQHLPDVLEYRLNRFHAADACGQVSEMLCVHL